jgi:hypothetical protein
MDTDTILKDMIPDLREKALADLRHNNPEIKAHAAHIVRLSRSFQTAIKNLSPYRQRVIEMYLDERSHLETIYYDQLYIRGFKDCVKLLRWLDMLR